MNHYPVLNAAAHNQKMQPSAPPEPMSFRNGFQIPEDMPLPDAIAQQVIYQKIMEQQRRQQPAPAQLVLKEEKQRESIPFVEAKPKGSCLAQFLGDPETSVYTASYLCIWRPKDSGDGIEIMMGQHTESKLFTFFGRNRIDQHPMDNALSAFQQQSGRKLDAETVAQIRRMLAADDDRNVFWKSEWKSALFYYQMAWDYQLVDNFAVNKLWNDEMRTLQWIDFQSLFDAVFISGDGGSFSPLTVGMLLHEENVNLLSTLHRRFGGDSNALCPVNGGSLRSTIKSFDRVPNAVRLDVIHPMTHQLLYRRWMAMEIDCIEDYHLLHSLIASICPEIGTNFLIYFTNNGAFKSSTAQYAVDTNPALQRLLKVLTAKNANNGSKGRRVTVLNVLPTFILEDNFTSISLACSRRDISWKAINATKDDLHGEDEKALESALNAMQSAEQNQYSANSKEAKSSKSKALEFAADWFPAEGIQLDVDYNGRWKWQFMNDGHEFQDFAAKNQRIVERVFRKGLGKATFHRAKVQYQVDIKAMVQKNLNTGNLRTIRRVPVHIKGAAPIPMDAAKRKRKRGSQRRLVVEYMKWQFEDEHGVWTDYPVANSKQLNQLKAACDAAGYWNYHSFDPRNTMTIRMKSGNKKWYQYEIDVVSKLQRNASTKKQRKIRQIPVYSTGAAVNGIYGIQGNGGGLGVIRNRWEWQDDDGSFKRYDDSISAQIEAARCSEFKKYFFVSTKNSNSYEIHFAAMMQFNVQSGKQRKVRRIPLEPEWKGPGPNPKSWTGPDAADRRTFGKKVVDLYAVIGAVNAGEVRASGKFMKGSLGPFGSGLYFYDSKEIAIHMAKHRTEGNKGYVVTVKVFVGNEMDVSSLDDKQFDFHSLQRAGKDSVTRSLGFGTEYIVYNMDQVCVVKVQKY